MLELGMASRTASGYSIFLLTVNRIAVAAGCVLDELAGFHPTPARPTDHRPELELSFLTVRGGA